MLQAVEAAGASLDIGTLAAAPVATRERSPARLCGLRGFCCIKKGGRESPVDSTPPVALVLRLEAIYYVAVVVLEVPSGFFSDVVGRKPTLLISSLAPCQRW